MNTDLISKQDKQAVVNLIDNMNAVSFYEANEHSKECYYDIRNAILAMPEQKPCKDTISRAEVHDLLATWLSDKLDEKTREVLEVIDGKVEDMSSVTPKQRTGKWQEVYAETDYRNGWIEFSCENCEYQHGLESGEYGWSYGDPIPWKYCPICGAKMVEPQESEDKE